MLELLMPKNHAVAILLEDHKALKQLFKGFKDAKTKPAREKIIREAVTILKLHAAMEEEIFYPAVRAGVGPEVMNEADEEHHVAKVLVAELDAIFDDHREARFTVLSELVKHHIKEEERMMLPKAMLAKADFVKLGELMLERRAELVAKGAPPDREAKMVQAMHGRGDSPAANARKKPKKSVKSAKGVRAHMRISSRSSSHTHH